MRMCIEVIDEAIAEYISFNKTVVAACKDRIAATEIVEHSSTEAQLVVHCKNHKFAEGTDLAVLQIDLD